jgi:hypothetical protein
MNGTMQSNNYQSAANIFQKNVTQAATQVEVYALRIRPRTTVYDRILAYYMVQYHDRVSPYTFVYDLACLTWAVNNYNNFFKIFLLNFD